MRSVKPIGRLSAAMIRRIGDSIAPRAKGEGRLCIVNYHRVLSAPDPLLESEPTVDTFRWQMDLLAECFNVIPLEEAVASLVKERMPPRAVAITFDDGYRSIHELALPILRERGLPATVFVTSGHMADDSSMWNDVILEAVRRLPDGQLDLRDIGLQAYRMESAEERKSSAARLTENCKYLDPAGRQTMLERLQQLVPADLRQHLMLTPEMIRDLVRQNIEIGGHTVTHPILACLDDETAFREIADNKRDLEQVTGRPVRMFAYPNGKQGVDFDQRHVEMVSAAGYHAAFTTAPGAATRHHNPFQFPRSRPWDRHPLMFATRMLRWLHAGSHV
jgi:peptidoglycan/xylan/chitin deacetylase (PgdA/CDA1 family)